MQHLALTKYAAILTLAPVNRAWGAMRDLCAGREAMARPPGSRGGGGAGGLPQRSRRATALLMTLAVLDVCSYFMHCLGALPCSQAHAGLLSNDLSFYEPTMCAASPHIGRMFL